MKKDKEEKEKLSKEKNDIQQALEDQERKATEQEI